MKNKYTILIIILCLISSFVYINKINNKKSHYTLSTNIVKLDYNSPESLYTENNDEINESLKNKETKTLDKTSNNIQNNNSLININNADKESLKTLPGIGDTLAQNIIDYRENISLFYNIVDIKNVDRIGDKIYEKIKNLITVN